jgi:glutaredoxin 1
VFITIYGSPNCKWCEKAVGLCMMENLEFTYHDMSQNPIALNFFRTQGFTTVPQIYSNGTHVGGFTEFQEYINEHKQEHSSGNEGTEEEKDINP